MRNAWIEIDLNHLRHNLNSLKEVAGSSEIMGIVKADAYGHGAVQISELLVSEGIRILAVADLIEALKLREAGITTPVMTLSAPPGGYEIMSIESGLITLVSNYSDAEGLSAAARNLKKHASIYLAVDTGMGREGFLCSEDNIGIIKSIFNLSNISVKGVLSHFAAAEWDNPAFSLAQLEQFNIFIAKLSAAGLSIASRTMANSAAMIRMPESRFDAVRPGISLYGQYPFPQAKSMLSLKPVMSVKARFTLIKTVEAGFSVSYGATFRTARESIIGVLPLGYADGLPLSLTNNGHVIVKGMTVPIVGRVCMDMCIVDLTDVPGVREYDEAIILGADGINEITTTDFAAAAKSSDYEVLCRFGQRLPKNYIG